MLNAANEVAVQAFLERRLNFLDIAAVIEAVLTAMTAEGALGSLDDVLAADAEGATTGTRAPRRLQRRNGRGSEGRSRMNLIWQALWFIVAVSLLVTVHEFGHYWVARRLGFKVLRFSVGFGRPLLRRVSGPDRTEYVIAAIPLGGYVKMLDEREGPGRARGAARSFTRKPPWQRILVLLAGPGFNILFAILRAVGHVLGERHHRSTSPSSAMSIADSVAAHARCCARAMRSLAINGKPATGQRDVRVRPAGCGELARRCGAAPCAARTATRTLRR